MAAVRRTRAQKELASVRRSEQVQYTFRAQPANIKDIQLSTSQKPQSHLSTQYFHTIFGYDTRLILGDLRSSVLVSVLLIIGLIVLSRV